MLFDWPTGYAMLRRWAYLITEAPNTVICLRQSLNAGVATWQPGLEDFACAYAKG